jgi:hypothetical protein
MLMFVLQVKIRRGDLNILFVTFLTSTISHSKPSKTLKSHKFPNQSLFLLLLNEHSLFTSDQKVSIS